MIKKKASIREREGMRQERERKAAVRKAKKKEIEKQRETLGSPGKVNRLNLTTVEN